MRLRTLTEAKQAKVEAELSRGTGSWPPYDYPVALEPPFAPFAPGKLTPADCTLLGIDGPYESGMLRRLFSPEAPAFTPEQRSRRESLAFLTIAPPATGDTTMVLAEHFLIALSTPEPIAFELIGHADRITVALATPASHAGALSSQLAAHYPCAGVTEEGDPFGTLTFGESSPAPPDIWEFCLTDTHGHPLMVPRNFSVDPLTACLGAMASLSTRHWAVLQVLLLPTRCDWLGNLNAACRSEWSPTTPAFGDYPDLSACEAKLERPLFAVALRLASTSPQTLRALESSLRQFASPLNAFARCPEPTSYADAERALDALLRRETYRFGMLLNSAELASIVHIPGSSVPCETLRRRSTKTAAAPLVATGGGIILGENAHRGRCTTVRISADLRNRHVYLIGSTRVGKTTLMLNMLLQDIAAGRGVGVIDPHGDLIVEEILPRVPRERLDDVVYVNPDDRDWPIAFNVLATSSARERELVCDDLLVVLGRLFAESWGPRMEHLLRYLLLTLAERPGSTLRDVRRLLDDDRFRFETVERIADGELRAFWEHEFAGYPESAFAPIRNKLGKFLAYPTVRNLLVQPESRLDFATIMDQGKVLLVNLSQGTLGEEASSLLGALIVSRLQVAAMGRAARPVASRRDFYLYVDEFQTYITSSFEKILSEAGKYRLNLTLANQFLKQLPDGLQAAILDNVGTLVCFRTGTDVARRLERELGSFTADDVANLDRGEAVVRMGAARESFNLKTVLPPPKPPTSHVDAIVARCRQEYASPRAQVEGRLHQERTRGAELSSSDDFYEV